MPKPKEIEKKKVDCKDGKFYYSLEFLMSNLEIESEEKIKEILGKEYEESEKVFDSFNREFIRRDLFTLLIKRSGNEENFKGYLKFYEEMEKRKKDLEK